MRLCFMVSFCVILLSSTVFAVDLGIYGNIYNIREKNIISAIKDKARQVNWKKEFNRVKRQIKDTAGKVDYDIPPALDNDTYIVDMSYTLRHDIPKVNRRGEVVGVLYPKGFTYNLLEYVDIPDTYVFFNGKRESEIRYFEQNYADDMMAKPIITEGDAMKLADRLKRPVYILEDNFQSIFNIQRTMSVAYQDGSKMRVDIIAIHSSTDNIPDNETDNFTASNVKAYDNYHTKPENLKQPAIPMSVGGTQ